jgi:acyl dehydratase
MNEVDGTAGYLEFCDLSIGRSASLVRSFSREDIDTFRKLAPDDAPVHVDKEFAIRLGFKGVLVFGMLAAAPFSGLLGMKVPGPLTVLHWVRLNMAAPVYTGELIVYRAEIKQLSSATKCVVLDLLALRGEDEEVVMRGQAQCGFRA